MPPKPKITREQILDAAFAIARTQGEEQISARAVADMLSCSTQPVLYHFRTMEELKAAVLAKAEDCREAYLCRGDSSQPLLEPILNDIRFAAAEKPLFRMLVKAGKISADPSASPACQDFLTKLSETGNLTDAQTEILFRSLFVFAHGCASLLAGGADISEAQILSDCERIFAGTLYAIRKGV